MTRLTTRRVGLMIAGLAGSAIALAAGQQQPSGAPVYTAAQAAAGRAAYQANCASCHVADLGGLSAGGIAGSPTGVNRNEVKRWWLEQ